MKIELEPSTHLHGPLRPPSVAVLVDCFHPALRLVEGEGAVALQTQAVEGEGEEEVVVVADQASCMLAERTSGQEELSTAL